MKNLSKFEKLLCSVQGKMFELSIKKGFASENFILKFMNSKTAAFFDLPFDRTQWLGEESLLLDLIEECGELQKCREKTDNCFFSIESIFWIGYIYRYWHFLTGESSSQIVRKCEPKVMNAIFPSYHTLDCRMAIERILESGQNL